MLFRSLAPPLARQVELDQRLAVNAAELPGGRRSITVEMQYYPTTSDPGYDERDLLRMSESDIGSGSADQLDKRRRKVFGSLMFSHFGTASGDAVVGRFEGQLAAKRKKSLLTGIYLKFGARLP